MRFGAGAKKSPRRRSIGGRRLRPFEQRPRWRHVVAAIGIEPISIRLMRPPEIPTSARRNPNPDGVSRQHRAIVSTRARLVRSIRLGGSVSRGHVPSLLSRLSSMRNIATHFRSRRCVAPRRRAYGFEEQGLAEDERVESCPRVRPVRDHAFTSSPFPSRASHDGVVMHAHSTASATDWARTSSEPPDG